MSKTNKELAVDVAIELIRANPRIVYKNDNIMNPSLSLTQVKNIINSINTTLNNIDKDSK